MSLRNWSCCAVCDKKKCLLLLLRQLLIIIPLLIADASLTNPFYTLILSSLISPLLLFFFFHAVWPSVHPQAPSLLESLINDVLGPAPPNAGTSQSNIDQGPSSMAQVPSSMAQGPSSMAQGPTVNGDAFASNTGPQMNSLNSFGSGSSGQQISNFGSSQSGSQSFLLQQAGVRPQCNSTERQTLYRSCAMSFGMAHMQYFRLMSSQRMCRPEMFSCK